MTENKGFDEIMIKNETLYKKIKYLYYDQDMI